ncbi:MAG: hypothetical protein QOD06_945 [Candidatus Binatota bacterium]|jgi:hypothetical protein|nr:hypothetical protein [Candidatus Binatota bacterium]
MGQKTGDKGRYNLQRKKKFARRAQMRELRKAAVKDEAGTPPETPAAAQ